MNTIQIDYNHIDPKYRNTVKLIEEKPHVRYIRYLMSKRYAPRMIKEELHRMALSAPHVPNLQVYYLSVMDPVIKAHGLGKVYADYKSKLLQKNKAYGFTQQILNYRIHLGDELDIQPKFHHFLRYMEIDEPWGNEIIKFHGSASRMPVDKEGNRVLTVGAQRQSMDKLLLHPKRYMLDKMILENISTSRIIKYFRDNHKTNLIVGDVEQYKRLFFNVRTASIEERIKAFELERNSLMQFYKDIDHDPDYNDVGIGEKIAIKRQSEQRITELDESLKVLTAMFSESAHKSAVSERDDVLTMFADVMVRGYDRFCQLDNYRDRDVVDPLIKVAKMMAFSHDKVQQLELAAEDGKGGDLHSQQELMKLYQKRMADMQREEADKANSELSRLGHEYGLEDDVNPDDIAGIEEIGADFDPDDFQE